MFKNNCCDCEYCKKYRNWFFDLAFSKIKKRISRGNFYFLDLAQKNPHIVGLVLI